MKILIIFFIKYFLLLDYIVKPIEKDTILIIIIE